MFKDDEGVPSHVALQNKYIHKTKHNAVFLYILGHSALHTSAIKLHCY